VILTSDKVHCQRAPKPLSHAVSDLKRNSSARTSEKQQDPGMMDRVLSIASSTSQVVNMQPSEH
jgi:hypothetical protein